MFECSNPITLPDFPPFRLEAGLTLGSCAKGWECVSALCTSSLLVPGVRPVSLDSRLLWVEGWGGRFSACVFPGFFLSGVETVLLL